MPEVLAFDGLWFPVAIISQWPDQFPSILLKVCCCLGAALLLVFAVLYFRERSRRKKMEQNFLGKDFYLGEVLREKEWLLREINHRVKNNLQIMISLLNSQEFFLKNKEALEAVRNSQRRLHAISLAYQKVYEPVKPTDIDMRSYITELIDYLRDEYRTPPGIRFELEIEQIYLPITSAVPVGMIINEAFSNSLRYAFPSSLIGRVQIKFRSTGDSGNYRLLIADNGIGLPSDFEPEENSSLGTSLMLGLSRQLRGEIKIKNEDGVSVIVEFANLKAEFQDVA